MAFVPFKKGSAPGKGKDKKDEKGGAKPFPFPVKTKKAKC